MARCWGAIDGLPWQRIEENNVVWSELLLFSIWLDVPLFALAMTAPIDVDFDAGQQLMQRHLDLINGRDQGIPEASSSSSSSGDASASVSVSGRVLSGVPMMQKPTFQAFKVNVQLEKFMSYGQEPWAFISPVLRECSGTASGRRSASPRRRPSYGSCGSKGFVSCALARL